MNSENNWVVYILECADETFYTGITNNLEKRFKMHQAGKAARYTSGRLPVKIIYSKSGYTESQARKEEFRVKGMTRQNKEKLIRLYQNILDT